MDHDGTYEVHGTVTGRGGDLLRQARVVVWWQQIRERAELAAGETSDNGQYHLSYQVPGNAPQPVLLVVEALSEFLDEPLFSPPTQAQPDLTIDLNLEPPDQSEWGTLVRSLEPLLFGVTLPELVENSTHQDISFLARQMATGTETIMRVAVCARLEAAFDIPAPAFYAFVRQRIPAALPSPLLDASHSFTLIVPLVQSIGSMIFRMSPPDQTKVLTSAVALDLIGPQYTSQIPQLVSQLQALRSTDLLNRPYLAGKTTLAQLLDVAGLPQDKHQSFAQALAANAQPMHDFWPAFGDGQHGLTAAEASAIKRTLSVGALVDNHVPLVQNLVQGFSSGTYQALPDLARLSRPDWVQLVSQTGPPPGIDAAGTATPAEVFASVVHNRVTRAYPTAALSGRITTGTFVPPPHQQPLVQFFRNNPDLDLVKDDIPAHLASAGDGAFAGISPDDQAAVVAHTRSFQRVLRVAPDPDVTEALLGAGIKSATQIATLGRQQFLAQATTAGLADHEANQAFEVAAQRQASVVSLFMQHNSDAIGIQPKAMGQISDRNQAVRQVVDRDPSLAMLFGSQDYCATDDCTSVLSPAAYLCDLLMWLRNHRQATQTALDVLDSRRPDIRHLLLNCPNTDTELPYIDLVNELLADEISPAMDSATTSYVQEALANGTPYYYIVTAVNAVGQGAPSPQVTATPVVPTAAPTVPGAVTATPGNAQITLSWDPVPGATSYNIYWSTTAGVTTATGTQITGATSPYVHTALANGTPYYYIVTAVNAAGEGAPSPQVSAAPAGPAAPAVPGGVMATPGNAQIVLSWAPVPGATSYNIYWSATAGITTATGTQITGATSPYVHTALANGTPYYYIVTAVNAAGEGAPSPQVSAAPAVPAVPAAPGGLTATPGNAQIILSWDPVSGASAYLLYSSTTAGVFTTEGQPIPPETLFPGEPSKTVVDGPLINGTTYYYSVKVLTPAGESALSPQVSATPALPTAAPATPGAVTATPGNAQIILSWAPVPGATSYNIYWSATAGVTTATGTQITTGDSNPSYLHTGLVNGFTYYYTVTAVNPAGASLPSTQVTATPNVPNPPPATPGGVTATPADAQITLSWDPAPGAISYDISWTNIDNPFAPRTLITVATSPYVHTALTNGTTYYYIVTAVNPGGASLPSTQVSAAPAVPTAAPTAPGAVTATPGYTQITLSWAPVPGATSYDIYWSTTAGVTTATGTQITGATSPHVHTALANGTPYYYIVTAVNAVGQGAPSPQVTATPAVPTAAPAAPGSVTATPGNAQIVLSWAPVPGATSYNIYWSTTAGITTATGTQITGATSPHVHTALANGTPYYYIVTAVNAAGQGAPSPQVTATPAAPAAPAPAAPGGVTATPADAQITLSWDPVPGATSYNIYWSATAGVTTATGTLITVATSPYVHTGLVNGTPYYYIVTAVNPAGPGAPSTQVTAAPAAPTAAPAAPGGVTATPADAQITLSWAPVPGATSYNIYWSATAGVTTATGTEITGARNPRWKQTSAGKTAADLSAAPEYFNQGAFAALSGASYPFTLPYSAGLDSLRTYLRQLKLPLWQLRQALLPLDGASISQQAAVAAERFGLTPHAENLIANPDFVPAPVAWNTPDPLTDVAPVDAFLAAASLTYESLLELLEVAWVQDGLNVAIQGVDDTCMTSKQSLAPLVAPDGLGFLDRAHRFLRLWLATGYKMWELDLLLTAPAVANGTLDQHALAALLAFRQLQDATGLTVDQQLTFYHDIDTATHRDPDGSTITSLYAQIFLNTAVTSVAPDPDLAALPTGGAIADPVLSHHLAGIQAAMGVTAADADILFGLTDSNLTLDNLSLIYRVNALAGAAKLSVSGLLAVAGLLDPTAVNAPAALGPLFASPEATLSFLAQATVIQQQDSLDLDALTYLLTPPDVAGGWGTTTQMPPADIATALGAVRQAEITIQSARTTLASPITASQTSITVASDAGFPGPDFSVAIGSEILRVTAVGDIGSTVWTVVRGQQGTTAASAAVGTPVNVNGAAIAAVTAISAVAANAHTARASGLANDVSALILQQLRVPGTALTLLAVLTDPAFTASGSSITQTSFPSQFLAIQLFDKAAVLVRGLRLVASDLTWLLENAAVYGGLDFTQLPVTSGQAAVSLPPLLTTLLVIKLARLWTAAPPSSAVQTLYGVISGVSNETTAEQAQGALATITGWPLPDIGAFASALGLAFPGNYTQPAVYDALRTLEAMAAAAGATGPQIVNWGTVPPDEPTAEGIAAGALGVLKAQQPSDDAWMTLAPTLTNPIRENRSAALQAYLIAQRDGSGDLIYADTDGLFDYFLIDVQMSSCQVTSRVVQAYIAVQTFVERCLMNLEAPEVVVDLAQDDTWDQWEWISRYRVWQANREVFLYPENWLIESQRPNRTEIYQTLEQEVRQDQSTTDSLETVVLNYIDRLDGLAHLQVTGTCQDPADGSIYVVARTPADPPVFYLRSFAGGAWTGWAQIPLNINADHAVPALYRGRVCLFWLDVKVSNEPQQVLPAAQASSDPPSQTVDRYVSLGVNFSTFRNGSWAPTQASKGKLFDKPFYDPTEVSDPRTVAGLYTLKVQSPAPAPGYGANLFIDVFRLGDFTADPTDPTAALITGVDESVAAHVGRALFDGRFSDLELRNLLVPAGTLPQALSPAAPASAVNLLSHATATYGPDAQPLLPLPANQADPALSQNFGLIPQAGAFITPAASASQSTLELHFHPSADPYELYASPVLNAAPIPWRVVGPDTDLNFDPHSYFFFEDNRRCYWVEPQKFYSADAGYTGWNPTPPSPAGQYPYWTQYTFHVFYHPFTGLFWNQLAGGGFDLLYDPDLQQVPDTIDPSYSDLFSFQGGYGAALMQNVKSDLASVSTTLASPISASQTTITVTRNIWVPGGGVFRIHIGTFPNGQQAGVTGTSGIKGTTWTVERIQVSSGSGPGVPPNLNPYPAPAGTVVTPDPESQDRQFLDFSYGASFAVYNWELFYHIPLYVAQLLSQNQQFKDAQTWFNYIFNPTRQGSDPTPQRFWIPKPLHDLTNADILQQQINNLLAAVNQGDPASVATINAWRNDPFNPFLLADQRPVAYMKSTVMSYLDNLIAWADNLFSTESREALGEATLLYVIASEILGPQPTAITPPQHADESFDQLEPSLDAFANALVEIENVIGSTGGAAGVGGSGGSAGSTGTGLPVPTFYFKIPSNAQLLGYWTIVADRLYKLRHCQNIAGAPLQLALFDAPIDPGLLIAAQAAGVDLSSVLSPVAATLPNYRFTSLYPQALNFVNAVRAYGASLQAALEKSDAGALALLQQTTQQQLLRDGSDILDWQVQQAQANLQSLNEALNLAQQKYSFNSSQSWENAGEAIQTEILSDIILAHVSVAAAYGIAGVEAFIPAFTFGLAGFGGSPQAATSTPPADKITSKGADVGKALAGALEKGATLAEKLGSYQRRQDNWTEAAAEASIQIAQAQAQIQGAQLALQVAQDNQAQHQEQIDNIQKQIDFLNSKFTSDSLYDWMAGVLSATYFQSYQLAYQMCMQLERCYQFELGIQDSSFIQFGYWDNLYKGLLAGETLNHDLRRMQASYLQQNARRYELSRYVSLGQLNPAALQQLLVTGKCDFSLSEPLFDNDYPGHYNRRLTRVSMTVVYPSPGKFDNVKATLTLNANKVRITNDTSGVYVEGSAGSDPRFLYNYAAVPQKIAMGNAQDDPGLFITAIASNIADQRYVPFENAGAVSAWHLEMQQINNEVDLSTVGDVVLHLYYTALDGGSAFQTFVQDYYHQNPPTAVPKVFSAQNDFAAPAPTTANPYPPTPWQAFLATVAAPASQTLTLSISPSKFPPWTRGKTISVGSITVLAVSWAPGNFVLAPQAPLPSAAVTMTPVQSGAPAQSGPEPNVCMATIHTPSGTAPGTWSFQLRQASAPDFRSLTKNEIGDVMVLVDYSVS